MTVVLITHYMEEAALADRVVVMDDGCVMADDTPEMVFEQGDLLKNLGLDVPQPTALCAALRQAGIDLPLALTPEECAEVILTRVEERK